jgi:hypothetical protein
MLGDAMVPIRLPGVACDPLAVRDGRVRVAERLPVVVGIVRLPVATMLGLAIEVESGPEIPSGL